MTPILVGLAVASPPHSITQADAACQSVAASVATKKQQRIAMKVYEKSGVSRRHSVLLQASTNGAPAEQSFFLPPGDDEDLGPSTAARMRCYADSAVELAERAARDALVDADVAAEEITHLVTVSCSGFSAPGFDLGLFERLALTPGVARTHVGFMGCHGALNGLRVAGAFSRADPHACVLVVATEVCSLHYQYDWSPEHIVANSLFADGAAAVVVRNVLPQRAQRTGAAQSPAAKHWRLTDSFSEVLPGTADAMTWQIGDNGFEMTLSAAVPQLSRGELRRRIAPWLRRHGLDVDDVGSWAIHPGGPRILDACEDALGLDDSALSASRDVLSAFGNMSSPTVLFVLEQLRRTGAASPCVMLGFGPGLCIEAAILESDSTLGTTSS
ncbi:MAG: type III polyketide synthase [Pirellulales bacterium]